MKQLVATLLILLLLSCKGEGSTNGKTELLAVSTELSEVQDWFSAWELVCRDVFPSLETDIPEFVFFDDKNVYATSVVSAPKGEVIEGPSLFGKPLKWLKQEHNGEIILPDGQKVPVGLMSFAAPMNEKDAFFVMAVPKFWEQQGVQSEELGLENMLTGVFLHEFSHTQQMQNFGAKISKYEEYYDFETDLNDDIVQHYFEKDTAYTKNFRQEVVQFFKASSTKAFPRIKAEVAKGLTMLKQRQASFFLGEQKILSELDGFFLTMEGTGQYAFYKWMVHPQGGNLSEKVALEGTRRGGTWWSQDEGLALFLAMEKLSAKEWTQELFGTETISVIDLLKKELN